MTPTDDYAFVGDPPMFRPLARKVHVSCSFTWDITEARRLAEAWAQHYYLVQLGGAAFGSQADEFTPGMYVKQGVTITSRGCNNQCPWCLVPEREGKLREVEIHPGNNIIDNNLLQCSRAHIAQVFDMLRSQHQIILSGGLDARLITTSIADDLRSLRVKRMFLACDTKEALTPLRLARHYLDGFRRDQLRCFVLLCFRNESISEAEERLRDVWHLGFEPFAMLYQPPDRYIHYSKEWRKLSKIWTRPARMKAVMRGENG